MNSNFPRKLSEHPAFRAMTERLEESRRFREQFPDVDADWEVALAEDEERRAAEANERREAVAHAELPDKLLQVGVPRRCAEALGTLRETSPLMALRGFMSGPATFCLLLGSVGVGKSVAASWALGEAIRHSRAGHGRKGRFVRAGDLAKRSLYDRECQADFEELCETRLLVVDDIGTEQASSTWQAQLDELLDRRYGDRLKTILTTNLDAGIFKARYGNRIADRIRHDGEVIGAGTESLRRPIP